MNTDSLAIQHRLAQAQRMHAAGNFPAALELYRQAAKLQPGNAQLTYLIGSALLGMGQTAEARKHFLKALKTRPQDTVILHDLAMSYRRDGRLADAHREFDKALKLKPMDPVVRSAKAEICFMQAQYQQAFDIIKPLLDSGAAHMAVAMCFARVCTKFKAHEQGIDLLRRALAPPGIPPYVAAGGWFRLANLADAVGHYDEAFEAYRRGHDLRARPYEPDDHTHNVDQMIRVWTRSIIAGLPRPSPSPESERPIFIVGMWRSGTTLVEQILASHPRVFGAGELPDIGQLVVHLHEAFPAAVPVITDLRPLTQPAIEAGARQYLDHLRRLSSTASRITDKMPVNFLHLGLIAALFPKSRIIHCTRHPLDTCLSGYFNLVENDRYGHDILHIGRFYNDYRRLMAHWKQTLDLPMLDVVYEELVADQHTHTRRIIEFAGLPWDDACLRFHENTRVALTASIEQVRQPMYRSSVHRYKNYERHLDELKHVVREHLFAETQPADAPPCSASAG